MYLGDVPDVRPLGGGGRLGPRRVQDLVAIQVVLRRVRGLGRVSHDPCLNHPVNQLIQDVKYSILGILHQIAHDFNNITLTSYQFIANVTNTTP